VEGWKAFEEINTVEASATCPDFRMAVRIVAALFPAAIETRLSMSGRIAGRAAEVETLSFLILLWS
jgi:hypothetical protein